MSRMDRLTDEALKQVARHDGHPTIVGAMARELLAHRRASQAAPAHSSENGQWVSRESLPKDVLPMFDLMVSHYNEAKLGWDIHLGRMEHTKKGIDNRIFAANKIALALSRSFGGTAQLWSQAALSALAQEGDQKP